MQSWSEITHYAGFDWATHHHDVVIVNRMGKIVADFHIEHTAEGWQRWREQVSALGPGVAACVETSQGFSSTLRNWRDPRPIKSGWKSLRVPPSSSPAKPLPVPRVAWLWRV